MYLQSKKEKKHVEMKPQKIPDKNKPKKETSSLLLHESKIEDSEDTFNGQLHLQASKEKDLALRRGKLSTVKMGPLIEVEEQKPDFLKLNLKKSEIIKSKIEKSKLESVRLKHHEFERCPQDNEKEETSYVRLRKPIHFYEQRKLEKDKPKKHRKKKLVEENTENKLATETGEKISFPPESAHDSLTQPLMDKEVVCGCFFSIGVDLIIVLRW